MPARRDARRAADMSSQLRRLQMEIDALRAEEQRLRRRIEDQRMEADAQARQQTAENARLYQQAQAAVRARDEFCSIAAHELKTPVAALRGFAQLELRRLRRGHSDPEKVRYAMEVIETQSTRLTRLIADLLDVSRMEGGKLRLEPEPVDLSDLVRQVVAAMHADAAGQVIVVLAPESAPVRADALRLEQVLTNLVDNAMKYSGELLEEVDATRPIEVHTAVLPGVDGASGGRVRLVVRDYGKGVPEEHRERIFDRFFQVDVGHPGAATQHVPGMGLGLYITRQIVEMHGGRIWVEAPEDGGARFVVELPVLEDSGNNGAVPAGGSERVGASEPSSAMTRAC